MSHILENYVIKPAKKYDMIYCVLNPFEEP
jgi:hypothetical protein